MNRKIRHVVNVEKHDLGHYVVREFTFDKNGNTVNMQFHSCPSFKEAHALKREILAAYN